MVFAAILLLFPGPQPGRVNENPPAAVFASESSLTRELPSAPQPKAEAGPREKTATESAPPAVEAPLVESSSLPTIAPRSQPLGLSSGPLRPAYFRPSESPRQRKTWYALAALGHSGAAFDAWSTRRAITSGYGTESNPLLRPFAHSGGLYVATQMSPLLMDFLGKRMMTNRHGWVRKMWWLPQTAGAGFSFGAGAHNLSLPH